MKITEKQIIEDEDGEEDEDDDDEVDFDFKVSKQQMNQQMANRFKQDKNNYDGNSLSGSLSKDSSIQEEIDDEI